MVNRIDGIIVMTVITVDGGCIEARKQMKMNNTRYDQGVLTLKTTKRDSGTKIKAIDTGTRKDGPMMPTVVGIKHVKRAASQPKPSRRAKM